MRAAFGIAITAFFFDPHRSRQDQVGGLAGDGRIDVGNGNEVFRVAVTGPAFLVHVGASLHVVIALDPVRVELTVLEHPVLKHGMVADLVGNCAFGQFPDFFGVFAVFGIGHHQIGGQAMGKRADFACGTTGRRLPGQREG